jgi:hypothetical protein
MSLSQLDKMPPTLLGLPRELRITIYENLTNNTHANINYKHPLSLETLPSGTRKYTHCAHSLMRTNRTLRTEVQEHLRQFNTYCVSQRYRAFAGLENMTLWKPAPVPRSARRLYLRIYIAIPRSLASKIAVDSLYASMQAPLDPADLEDLGILDDHADDFTVLESVLRDCFDLEEMVLEFVVRGQDTVFGRGRESLDSDQDTQAVAGLGVTAMEREMQKLPCLRRYATVVDGETKFMRRNIGENWTRHCLIPSCVPTCHCYGAYGTTCVEDSGDLLAGLTPRAADEWVGFNPDSNLSLGS